MAAFVAVAGIDTGADEAVADVKACPQGGFHIAAVEGVHIHGVVGLCLLGCGDELTYHIVAVGAAGILGTDGNLLLGALQTVTHTAHVHGNGFRNPLGQGSGAAVTHFFIDGDVEPGFPGGDDLLIRQILGKAQENAHAELVVQETALQIAGGGFSGAGFETDDVTHLNAQLSGVGGAGSFLVQNHFCGVPVSLSFTVVSVYMDGGIAQLQGAFVDLAVTGIDSYVFCFTVVGLHTAQCGQPQTAIALDFRNHTAQGIGVGSQHQTVLFVFAPQIHQQTAFGSDAGGKAQGFKLFFQVSCYLTGETGRRVDTQNGSGLLPGVVGVRKVNHIVLLK